MLLLFFYLEDGRNAYVSLWYFLFYRRTFFLSPLIKFPRVFDTCLIGTVFCLERKCLLDLDHFVEAHSSNVTSL